MECPATPPDIADCALLRTPSPTKNEFFSGEDRNAKSDSLPNSRMENKDNKDTNSKSKDDERCNSPDPGCAICLGQIENMSYTDSCFHKFCFTCLLEWSKVRPVCPLCKARFKSIIHTIQSDKVYESYTLPPPPATNSDNAQASRQEMQLFLEEIQRFRQNLSQQFRSGFASFQSDWRQRNRQQNQPTSEHHTGDLAAQQVLPSLPPFRFPSRSTSAGPLWNRRRGVATSAFRRNIYRQNLYVEAGSIIDITGRVRECTADWYRNNQAQTHRLVPWLNRELNALMETQVHQVPYVLQLILDLIQRFNIQSPEFHEQMVPYTGTRTNHFQHEFYNLARSTYDMIGYDRNAIYNAVEQFETYVVSSDSTSSSSDDEVDVQVEPSPVIQNSASVSEQSHNDDLIVVDDVNSPLTTSSGSNDANTGINEPMASTSSGQTAVIPPSPLIISSGESDINPDIDNNDVEIVNYVKPRKDRTPVIVNIESSDDDIIRKEKPKQEESSQNAGICNSSIIALSPPVSARSPAIVILGDSSPESSSTVLSSVKYKKSIDKPLWKRNFETCFPTSAERNETSNRIKRQIKDKKREVTKRSNKKMRLPSLSSSSNSDPDNATARKRSKISSSRNKRIGAMLIRTRDSSSSSMDSSSTIADEGGWFRQSDDSICGGTSLEQKTSKGKGKGKGKSSQVRKENEKSRTENHVEKPLIHEGSYKRNKHSLLDKKGRQTYKNIAAKKFPSDSEDLPLTHKRNISKNKKKIRKSGDTNNQQEVSNAVNNWCSNDSETSSTIQNSENTKLSSANSSSNESSLLGCQRRNRSEKNVFDSDSSSSSSSSNSECNKAQYDEASKKDRKSNNLNFERENRLREKLVQKMKNKEYLDNRNNISSDEPSLGSNRYENYSTVANANEGLGLTETECIKLKGSASTNTSVKSVVVKVDSNSENYPLTDIGSQEKDYDRISKDLRVKLDQRKKLKKKAAKEKMIKRNIQQLSTSDNDIDEAIQNAERIVITSTLNKNFHNTNIRNDRTVVVHPMSCSNSEA